jgi:hypothetical protein
VKTPDRIPARMITITSRPGAAAAIERHIAAQPGKLPAG